MARYEDPLARILADPNARAISAEGATGLKGGSKTVAQAIVGKLRRNLYRNKQTLKEYRYGKKTYLNETAADRKKRVEKEKRLESESEV